MKKPCFSKTLLVLESAIVLYTTHKGFALATLCIMQGYDGALPWITTMVTAAWGAYGASAGFYYNKSKAENSVGGVVYETAMKQHIEESV